MWNEAPFGKHQKARSDGRLSRFSMVRRDGGLKVSRSAESGPLEACLEIGLTSKSCE